MFFGFRVLVFGFLGLGFRAFGVWGFRFGCFWV